ncbi:Gfo/Idh/MocA family protein [Nocardia takedensis]
MTANTDARGSTRWEAAVEAADIDAVVVCTPPHLHRDIVRAALAAGKHVLCEKPLTRTSDDAAELAERAETAGLVLHCGFNHRCHPALAAAQHIVATGAIGRPVFGRGVYGIGGRPGLEQEWRSDPSIAAGGQLMEQGIHLVDLFRWMIGDFDSVLGTTANAVFPIAPLEDSGVAVLQRADGCHVTVHSTLAQWKNRFSFELYGTHGYVEVTGLGGGYGTEVLRHGIRDAYAPFSETVTEYRGQDRSWQLEWEGFVTAVRSGGAPPVSAAEGAAAMRLVEAAYRSSATGRVVAVGQREDKPR